MATDQERSDLEGAKQAQQQSSVELPAPKDWKKIKFTLTKSGTPRKNPIIFIAPTGEEIKHKTELEKYLKAHPGNPPLSEFDWGTGDTPRRSGRLKSKATETPEPEPAKKRERKSSSKKGTQKEKDINATEDEAPKDTEDVAVTDAEGVEACADAEKKDTEVKDNNVDKVATEDMLADETKEQGSEDKSEMIVENAEKEEEMGEGNDAMKSDTMENQIEDDSTPAPKENNDSEVPAEKMETGEEETAEGSKVDDDASLNKDTKVGEDLPGNSSQTSLKGDAKTGEGLPENSNPKDGEEDYKPKDCEIQPEPKSSPAVDGCS